MDWPAPLTQQTTPAWGVLKVLAGGNHTRRKRPSVHGPAGAFTRLGPCHCPPTVTVSSPSAWVSVAPGTFLVPAPTECSLPSMCGLVL